MIFGIKRPSTFRTLRPVNGLIFSIRFDKLEFVGAEAEQPPPEVAFPYGEGGRAYGPDGRGEPNYRKQTNFDEQFRPQTVQRLPCVKGAVSRRLTEGSTRLLPFILARFFGRAGSPSSVPGCARSTFPVGEGFLRRGLLIGSVFPLNPDLFVPFRSYQSKIRTPAQSDICVNERPGKSFLSSSTTK